MAAIALPSSPAPSEMEVHYLDWGGRLVPALGGPAQRFNRLGNRHRVDVTLPPMTVANARLWVQRLKRGQHAGVLTEFLQPGFTTTLVSGAVSQAVAAGSTIPISGLPPGATIAEGQWFSVIVAGVRQLYSSDQSVVVNGAGAALVGVTPMLRSSIAAGAVVEFAAPMIEGSLAGDKLSWTIDAAHHYGLQFSIEEDR